MKTLVFYKSKCGFVRNYAEWIAEELNADIFDAKKISFKKLLEYDTIIYGGGVYAAGINGINFIKANAGELKDKNIIVFASGASPERNEIIEDVRDKNFNMDEQECIKFFYMRGGFDYNRLGFFDKILMNALKSKLSKKEELTSDEAGMLSAYDNPVDFTRKQNTEALVNYVKAIEGI